MAKSGVTVFLIFCFIAISHAFSPLDLPESDVISDRVAKTDTTVPKLTESNTVHTTDDLPSTQMFMVDHVDVNQPGNLVGFRTINRHFNAKRQFGLRLPIRRCNGHKKALHGSREVSYGNDMILAEGGRNYHLGHHHRYHDRNGLPEFPFERQTEYQTQPANQENALTNKIRKFLIHF